MKKTVCSLILSLAVCFSFFTVFAFAESNSVEASDYEGQTDYFAENINYVVDSDDLLTDQEENELQALLAGYSYDHGVSIVVVTAPSLNGKSAEAYADDYFDYNGYGEDGILFLISMEYRDWHMSTRGLCISAFTDDGLDAIADDVLPYVSEGEYYEAFTAFGEHCNDYLINYGNGKNYDGSDSNGNKKSLIFIALAVGFGLAFIPMGKYKKQLKSVEQQSNAKEYTVKDSVNITQCRDSFIGKNVTRTPKPKESSSSGGGSSTHTSSSGATHGGRGGKF